MNFKNSALLICLFSIFLFFQANAYAENTFTQRELLLSHQFSSLENNLALTNDNYLNGSLSLNDYYAVTRMFWLKRDVSDPALFNALKSWLKAKPDSAYAHVLMGVYWSDKAHQARGGKWAKDTADSKISTMNKYFITSWDYLQKGLQLNPAILQAYVTQLSITRTSSHFGSPQQLMQKSIPAAMKHKIEVWDTLLQTSIPRWGGSYQRMDYIIDQEIPVFIPNLSDVERQILNDTITYDRVDTMARNDKNKMALKLATKSIDKKTQNAAIYTVAAKVAYKIDDFETCYNYAGIAVRDRPWSASSWKKRGLCAIKLQHWQQANEAFRYTVFIKGINKYDLFNLGMTYMYLEQFDKAYASFKKADELDPEYVKYTDMYTSYIEKEKTDQMGLEGTDIYKMIGTL